MCFLYGAAIPTIRVKGLRAQRTHLVHPHILQLRNFAQGQGLQALGWSKLRPLQSTELVGQVRAALDARCIPRSCSGPNSTHRRRQAAES